MNNDIFLLEIRKLIEHYLLTTEQRKEAISSSEELKKRATNFFEKAFFFHHVERLMPLAKKAILEFDNRKKSFPFATVWLAKELKYAKGRRKRIWFAPPGGIYMCITLYKSLLDEFQHLYSLALPVVLSHVFTEMGLTPEIRWLNDVLLNGKKVAGILSESVKTKNLGEEYLLFGIGINANIKRFPKQLEPIATSLLLERGTKVDLKDIVKRVLARVAILFSELHKWQALILVDEGAENPVIKEYLKFAKLHDRKVIYGMDLEEEWEKGAQFTCKGLTFSGSLRLIDKDGTEFSVNTGEIRFID